MPNCDDPNTWEMCKGKLDGNQMSCWDCGKPVNVNSPPAKREYGGELRHYVLCTFCIAPNFIE